MGLFIVLEIIGTAAFAVSGALLAVKKNMDLLGVCVLGLTTACGGGMLRDIIIGKLPPVMFTKPVYALTAIVVSLLVFAFSYRRQMPDSKFRELVMLVADSVGLGIFSVAGVSAAVECGYGGNIFFAVFLGTMTGVGGGVIRDMMAGMPPYIFVKHIYACASIAGALLCSLLWNTLGQNLSMLCGCILVFAIRLLAAHYRWSLPHPRPKSDLEIKE